MSILPLVLSYNHQRRAEQRRIGNCCEVDEADAVATPWRKRLGDGHGNCNSSSTIPPAPAKVTLPVVGQQIGDFDDFRFAADVRAQQWRIGQGKRIGKRQIVLDLADADLHIRDELVPAARHGGDIEQSSIWVSPGERRKLHMLTLRLLSSVEEGARPGRRHQLILAAASSPQRCTSGCKGLECAPAQFDGASVEKQQLTAGNQSKWAEAVREFLPACAPLPCLRGGPH